MATAALLAYLLQAVGGLSAQSAGRPSFAGRWIFSESLSLKVQGRAPLCDRECVMIERGEELVIESEVGVRTYGLDGLPRTSTASSQQGYVSEMTTTTTWRGPVLEIEWVTRTPGLENTYRSIATLSLDKDLLTIEGVRPMLGGVTQRFRNVYQRCLAEKPKPCR